MKPRRSVIYLNTRLAEGETTPPISINTERGRGFAPCVRCSEAEIQDQDGNVIARLVHAPSTSHFPNACGPLYIETECLVVPVR